MNSILTTDPEQSAHACHAVFPASADSPPSADLAVLVTPARQTELGRKVLDGELSRELTDWCERYSRVGRRPAYLWKWCRRAVEITTLPCLPATSRQELCDTKTLGVMWDVMLDDLADQGGNPDLLEELLCLPQNKTDRDFGRFNVAEQQYAEFTCELWDAIIARLQSYPLYATYTALLRFDYLQLCNVMRYSHLLNESIELLNVTEHDLYTPHNMHIMICSTMDLMASQSFLPTELGRLRKVIWHAQWMGRIGNLVTTWEREIGERDFTSGVFARAIENGDLTFQDLLEPAAERIRRAIANSGQEEFYLQTWNGHRQMILAERDRFRSFDVQQLVTGLEELICLHLASRGRK